MYIVIRAFKDSMDNDRFYRVGDVYPAGGGKVNKKRAEELLLGTNRNGRMYIREVNEDGSGESADGNAGDGEGADGQEQ